MLFRLIIGLIVLVGGFYAFGKLRTPALLRVPRSWKDLALKSHAFRKALASRQGMAAILHEGKAQHTAVLLTEVDSILTGMEELQEQRLRLCHLSLSPVLTATVLTARRSIQEIDADLGKGMTWLDEAHSHLLGVATNEHSAAADSIRANLQDKGLGFQSTLDAYRDMDKRIAQSTPERELS